jgi:Protein of unknown function (DUF2911)
MKRTLLPIVLLVAVGSFVGQDLRGEPPKEPKLEFPQASPSATVKDRVGITDVEIEYGRPGVKGRKIFGGLVPYGEVWRTGANSATKVTFGTEVNFGGTQVPAGSYALFTIPESGEWTVILNKAEGQWGSYAYDAKNDMARVKVKPVALTESLETMTISLEDLRDDAATLNITWDKARVPVKLQTNLVAVLVPKIEAAMAGPGKKPYFDAAMFYYAHDLDLKKAVSWIDEATQEQPDAFWIFYRKGLILAKSGDKPGAIAAANRSLELANKAGGAVAIEYKRLNEALIASLR